VTADHGRHEVERQAIREAAGRLLGRSGSKPTIESLCREAGLSGRWILSNRHVDLKDDFLRAVSEKWGPNTPAVAVREKQFQELKEKYDDLQVHANELERIVDAYAAVIVELRQQRDELLNSHQDNKVVPLHES
jgi:hypothetical protein